MTCENYTCNNANAVEKEQERKLTVHNMASVNYDVSKSCKNVILEHDSKIDEYKSFRGYVKDYKEEHGISGRFNIDTTCDRNATKVLSCFVMSANNDLISSMTRTEQIEYFKSGLEFLKEEYPTFHIVDSRIHYDEKGLPHMHTSMLPIHVKEDGRKTFNVTQHQKGKDYFRGFQDRFYEYMKERYPEKDLQRTDENRTHDRKMSVTEYKEFQELNKDREEARKYNEQIEHYCNENGISIYQYEKQCFWADRGVGDYPEPEGQNPERTIAQEIEKENIYEHNR